MNPAAPGPVDNVFAALVQGVPILIVQILVCVVLLAIGIAIYVSLTPFREHELVGRGNTAAGIALGGAILALALPLAAMLATSTALAGHRRVGRGRIDPAIADIGRGDAGDAQSRRPDQGGQYRRGDRAGRRTARRRVAQRGGDGTYLTLTPLKLTPDKETLRCWRSCET